MEVGTLARALSETGCPGRARSGLSTKLTMCNNGTLEYVVGPRRTKESADSTSVRLEEVGHVSRVNATQGGSSTPGNCSKV